MNWIMNESSYDIFHSIIEHNPDAIIILSLEGQVTRVNQMTMRLFGYSEEQLLDVPIHTILKPEQEVDMDALFAQLLKGQSYESDMDGVHHNGRRIRIQVKFIPLTVKDDIVGVFCVVKDLTELLKTKASLNRVEDILTSLFNSVADSVALIDLTGKIIDVNPAFEKMYQLRREEVINQPYSVLPIIPKDRLSQAVYFINKLKSGEDIIGFETTRHLKDGTTIDVSLTLSPIRDEYGHITAISSIARDITQPKQLQRSLLESEKRYRLLADNSLDIIQQVDLDGMVLYASPSHKTVLGYDPEEYIGKWVFYQPNGYIDDSFKESFLNMALTQKPFVCEMVRKHKAGFDVWLEVKGTPMFDGRGTFKYMMFVGHEITERKKQQKHLEHLGLYDPLTGIPNRRLFEERLDHTLAMTEKNEAMLAVMYLDMDHFKQINDTFGHNVGDDLLRQFSHRVRGQLRPSDTFARQGGDEFTMLLPDIQDEEAALRIAERILFSLQHSWKISNHVFDISSSIGIAFYPKDGVTREELLKHADQALYVAKRSGRNRFDTYQGNDDDE